MSNNQLPADVQERIKQQAAYYSSYSEDRDCKPVDKGRYYGYIAGATAEAQCKLKYDELVAENERLKRWKAEALTLLTLVDAYADKHPEIKLGQGKVEFTIAHAKERDTLKERCEKMERELRRCSLTLTVHPDYQPNSEFRDLAESINEALKEGESNTPAPAKEIEYMPILSAELSELRKYANVPARVPMYLLNEEQAHRNHGQTLQRLKERGGLGIKEALSLITCTNWSYYRDLPMKEALAMLNDLISNNIPAPGKGKEVKNG